MEKQLRKYLASGALFTAIVGTLSHFLYEWSGNSLIIGLFCPVNESVWEHIKLLFFPMLLTAPFLDRKTENHYPCVRTALLQGLLSGCLLIPVLFYTYTGILGFHLAFVDIAIFYISTAAAYLIAYRRSLTCGGQKAAWLWRLLTLLLALAFVVFTLYPPAPALFQSP